MSKVTFAGGFSARNVSSRIALSASGGHSSGHGVPSGRRPPPDHEQPANASRRRRASCDSVATRTRSATRKTAIQDDSGMLDTMAIQLECESDRAIPGEKSVLIYD